MKRIGALLFETSHFEDDLGFKQVIYNISRKGMVAAGLLGVVSVAINFITNALAGYLPALTYTNPGEAIVIWDKLILFVFSVAYIGLSRTEKGPQWARSIGVGMALTATIAIILDDLGQQTAYVSHHYIGIIVLLLVTAIPFQPRQAIAFNVLTTVTYLTVSATLSRRFGILDHPMTADIFVYLFIVFFLVVGISSLLYRTRYDEYLARRSARDAESRVRELEHTKSQFFANISHEFRTPLTLILGPVRDAIAGKYGEIDSDFVKRLRVVDKNAVQLQYLIDELLDLSSLEAGKLSLQIKQRELDALLRSTVASFQSLSDSSSIVFEYDDEAPDVSLFVDEKRFQQIITNLLANAFKFTNSGGRVRLAVRATDSEVIISVKDNGKGIELGELPFVFDRFRKVDSNSGIAGTGIGLSLVKELVELHGGQVTATSDLGFGSEFIVTLRRGSDHFEPHLITAEAPASDGLNPSIVDFGEAPVSSDARDQTNHQHTILIVDDNSDMRSYLHDVFRSQYNVIEAANGRDGLEQARSENPDMIVSDVMMPEMNGIEFCQEIRKDSQLMHTPVILLTAKVSDEARQEGLLSRADDYVTKPFNSVELLIRAENLIEIRKKLHLRYGGVLAVEPIPIDVKSTEDDFMGKVRTIIQRELSNTYFSVDHLADELDLGRRQVERRLKSAVGLTPAGYIRVMRLQRAAQLLDGNFGSISAVSREVGFPDPSYFAKLFGQAYGVLPSQYSDKNTETES